MCAYREGVDIAELLELEHQGWSSLGDRSGADFYGGLMTPDGVMVLAHGQVLDRAEVPRRRRRVPRTDVHRVQAPSRAVAAGAIPADTDPARRVILRCQQSTPSSRRHAGGSSWSGP